MAFGLKFDSKWESERWGQLKAMEKAGVVTELERQVRYTLAINDENYSSNDGAYLEDLFYYFEGNQYTYNYYSADGYFESGSSTYYFNPISEQVCFYQGDDNESRNRFNGLPFTNQNIRDLDG